MKTRPSDRRTTPATATPTPTIGPASRTRSWPASRTSSATTSSTWRCWSGRSTRTRSSVRPPSPTTAAAIESTRTSNARTTAPSARGGPAARDGPACRGGRRGPPRRGRPRQLANEGADRAPRQSGRRHELRAGARAVLVEHAEDGAEVRSMDRLAALPGHRGPIRMDLCSFLANVVPDSYTVRSCQVARCWREAPGWVRRPIAFAGASSRPPTSRSRRSSRASDAPRAARCWASRPASPDGPRRRRAA